MSQTINSRRKELVNNLKKTTSEFNKMAQYLRGITPMDSGSSQVLDSIIENVKRLAENQKILAKSFKDFKTEQESLNQDLTRNE